jgi:hypothetical protein
MEDVAKLIVGAWRLVHSIIIDADGKKEYPFGEDAIGYICYRAEVKDLSLLKHDYLSYFGRYEIDTEKQVVRHFVEGQLFPGTHPAVLERTYRFEGDLMSLRPEDRTNQEILWQRVRA